MAPSKLPSSQIVFISDAISLPASPLTSPALPAPPTYDSDHANCIIVTWWSGPGRIQALPERPTGFLQCFDTVGLVIWPVKIVPDMTYNVFGGMLNLAQSYFKVRGQRSRSQ